jgi:hypothetical protein
MATTTTSEKAVGGTQPISLPPEEKFWQRYSPHQEMPLSTIGSFAIHLLVIGGLILSAWLGWFGFGKSDIPLKEDLVTFDNRPDPSEKDKVPEQKPGGGNPANPIAATENKQGDPPPGLGNDKRPNLDLKPLATPDKLDLPKDDVVERLVLVSPPNIEMFETIKALGLSKSRDDLKPGKGPGGTGKDGVGGRNGNPKGPLPISVKRMLRWSLIFNTRSGQDYLNQLRSLDAILAIPVGDGNSFKIVRDLSGNGTARLLDEDVSSINRIFWSDNRPESVAAIMKAIGYPKTPSHFVAFMPKTLEQDMYELEAKYMGRSEDQIHETTFVVVRQRDGNYRPVVKSQTGR